MTSKRWWRGIAAALLLASCSAGDDLGLASIEQPETLVVEALSIHAVKVEWPTEPQATYHLERRVNLTGPFVAVPPGVVPAPSNGRIVYVDSDVEPNTYYGYRLRASTTLGETSDYSPVRGARTPPPPGIAVITTTSGNYSDPNGYVISIVGPGEGGATSSFPIGVSERKVSPVLPGGSYAVTLDGVDPLCDVLGEATRPAEVDDGGLNTIATVTYDLACRDPSKGQITATVAVAGGGTNATPFTLKLEGIIQGGAASVQTKTVPAGGGTVVFNNLRPGSYQLTLSDLSDECTAAGGLTWESPVQALDDLSTTFDLTCSRPDVDPNAPGYKLRGTWSPVQDGRVTYTIAMDMGAFNDPAVNGTGADDISNISATTHFDPTKLTFVESQNAATGTGLLNQGSNLVAAGAVAWLNYSTGSSLLTGMQPVIRLVFSVNPAATGTVAPFTEFGPTDDVLSKNQNDLKPRVVVLDEPLSLGGTSTSLTAKPNGPYSGTASTPIGFSAAGSVAAPGRTITAYEWSFSDGGAGTGASIQHTFAAAGTFTATLTVRDDQGATAAAVASVTVGAAGGSQPFTWRNEFGSIDPVDGLVTLTITLDLSADIPETAGPEALQSFGLDSITWNPAVLQYRQSAFLGGNWAASVQTAPSGRLLVLNSVVPPANSTGSIGIMLIRFAPIGPLGSTTTTKTYLSSLLGTEATGPYDYLAKTRIVEGTFTRP